MNNTDNDDSVRLDPPPPPPEEITAFVEWLGGYCDVGDPGSAVIHYRHLHGLLQELQDGLSVLRGDVVDGFGPGLHHRSGLGAFKIRKGAKRYIVAKKSDGDLFEYRRLLRDVVATVEEGEDPLPTFESVWPMGPGDARWTAVKNLGLNPNDYREPDGWTHSIDLL